MAKPPPRRKANPASGRPARRTPKPFVFGFLVGTAMVVAGGYLLLPPPAPPGLEAVTASADVPAKTTPKGEPKGATPTTTDPTQTPVETPGYDFYTILQDMEVKVPDWQVDAEQRVDKAADSDNRHVLQVGAFKSFADADRVKADLALKGITASIQTVDINRGERWYRVRIGPFQDLDLLKQARAQLILQGVGFIVVKERRPKPATP